MTRKADRSEGEMPLAEDERRRSFELEDRRWETRQQVRDWMWLAVMIIVYTAWTLFVYLVQPGLR